VEIRPGVFRPDWSAVTKPAPRQALTGRLAARAGLLDRWSCRLEPDQDVVWRTALRLYAERGRAPSIADLAATADIAVDKLTTLLNDLASRDLIGLDRAPERIRLAYPFTEAETGHRVVGFDGLTASVGAGSLCLSANKEVVYNSASDSCLSSLRATKHDINSLALGGLPPASTFWGGSTSRTIGYSAQQQNAECSSASVGSTRKVPRCSRIWGCCSMGIRRSCTEKSQKC
jgi:hypothetical protein